MFIFNYVQNYTTPEKGKAKTSPPVTPINEIIMSPKAPPVTPINSGKRLAGHASSYSATLKELSEGEQSTTRLRHKHVKIEKK